MVSEGVDIPRLRVGVYATSARTELFFRQVVGRFIRRTPAPKEQMSHVFLPADPTLKRLAAQVEEERRHALTLEPKGEPLEEAVERVRSEPGDAFRALSSSAHGEAEMLLTTQPGETMSLFAADPPPSPALAAFTQPAAATHERAVAARARRRRTSGASGCATSAARSSPPSRASPASRTRSSTRGSTATPAPRRSPRRRSAQLEKGNALLEREAARGGADDGAARLGAGDRRGAVDGRRGPARDPGLDVRARRAARRPAGARGAARVARPAARRPALRADACSPAATSRSPPTRAPWSSQDPMAVSDRVVAVRLDVDRIQAHGQPRFQVDAGVRWHWTDPEAERQDAAIRSALAALAAG